MIDTLRSFRQLLIKKAGIYGFQKIETGEIVYIGSTINLWKRFFQHITGNNSNLILQRAIAKYSLASFRFIVFEFITVEEYSIDTLKGSLLMAELFRHI